MIKRINDDRLSEVNGGGSKSIPLNCFCNVACSCRQDKLTASTAVKGAWEEVRSFTRNNT